MQEYLKILHKSWIAMVMMEFALIIIIYLLSYFYHQTNDALLSEGYAVTFSYVLMLVMVVCVFLGGKGSNRKLKKINTLPLPKKLTEYRLLQIKRLRAFSLINIIALLGLFVCNQTSYLLFSIIAVVLTLLCKVSELKLKVELALSEEDIENMNKIKFEKK